MTSLHDGKFHSEMIQYVPDEKSELKSAERSQKDGDSETWDNMQSENGVVKQYKGSKQSLANGDWLKHGVDT